MGTTMTTTDRDKVLSRCKWHADSGHEWLQVPLSAAREADKADKANGGDGISTFSYVKGMFAYLEGDCDAALFIKHFGATDSEAATIEAATIEANGVALYTNLAPLRDYPRWEA
jgi:hypothetical protein